jgi:lipoate-protein ligase B
MRQLEETVIVCLNKLNIKSIRLPEVNSGVWIDNNKISAVGVTASRWITNHGSAINIHCDLESFQCIIPCGIRDTTYGVCRLVDILQQKSTDKQNESYDSLFNRVQKLYIESLQEVFQYDHMSLGNNNELDDILGQYPEIQAAELHAIHR